MSNIVVDLAAATLLLSLAVLTLTIAATVWRARRIGDTARVLMYEASRYKEAQADSILKTAGFLIDEESDE